MGIRGRQYTPMDEPVFNKAIPGTEALAGALKDYSPSDAEISKTLSQLEKLI